MAQHHKPIELYSIQQTYILNIVSMPSKQIVTCDQRIDIPTIEPLVTEKDVIAPSVIIPCIELACFNLRGVNFTFETNEGVTVLPVKIDTSRNPYRQPSRYVLVLPRDATGVKSCKITLKDAGFEIPNNLTFGIMPPPYNYDNALFAVAEPQVYINESNISDLITDVNKLYTDIIELKRRVADLENKVGS